MCLLPVSFSQGPRIQSSDKKQNESSDQKRNTGIFGCNSEATFTTSFCNELFLYPRVLHNCSKRNLVVKVELRHCIWNEELSTRIAYPPIHAIHNQRRGQSLLTGAFTSCAYHCINLLTHFMMISLLLLLVILLFRF